MDIPATKDTVVDRNTGAGGDPKRAPPEHRRQAGDKTEDWLRQFPALNVLPEAVWLETKRIAKRIELPAGTVVIRSNDPCSNLLLVVSGAIRVYQRAASGREQVLFRTRGGEICILTLQTLLARTTYSAEAVTETDVRFVSIPAEHFFQLMSHSEAFRAFILSTLANRLSDMMHLVEQVTFKRLDLRLACLLGQHFAQQGPRLSITHQELAAELGSTREVVSRLLKDFERAGCLRLYRGKIEVLSPTVLDRLSNENPV